MTSSGKLGCIIVLTSSFGVRAYVQSMMTSIKFDNNSTLNGTEYTPTVAHGENARKSALRMSAYDADKIVKALGARVPDALAGATWSVEAAEEPQEKNVAHADLTHVESDIFRELLDLTKATPDVLSKAIFRAGMFALTERFDGVADKSNIPQRFERFCKAMDVAGKGLFFVEEDG